MQVLDIEKLSLFAAFLLLVISLVLTFRRKRDADAGKFLTLYFWFSFYNMFIYYMVSFGHVRVAPHLFRTGLPISLLMMPASYFYIRQSLNPSKLTWTDLVHFLPAVFLVIDFFPFYSQSAEEKLAIINGYGLQELTVGFSQGQFMPTYGHSILRYVMALVYTILQWRLIVGAEKKYERKVYSRTVFFTWLQVLVLTEIAFYLVPLVAVKVLGMSVYAASAILAGIAVAFIQGHYLFFNPNILYGIRRQATVEPVDTATASAQFEDPESAKLEMFPEWELEQVGRDLELYMREHKPYLRGKLKLQDLARATGYPVVKISSYINRNRNQNYFAYLNEFRIGECLEKFESGEHHFKTLEALAEECGFPNRATFIRVFKQVAGKTPTEYLAGLRDPFDVSSR